MRCTQRDHARCVVEEHHADYLFQVKDNQPNLLATLVDNHEKFSGEHAESSKGHGRTKHRYVRVADAPDGVDFPRWVRGRDAIHTAAGRSRGLAPGPGRCNSPWVLSLRMVPGSRVSDTPDRPRENLKTFFGNRLATQLALTVSTMGHAVSGVPYVLQHRKQVLLSRHRSEAVDRHRGSLADALAEGDCPGLFDRRSEFCKLRLEPLLSLGQHAVNVGSHFGILTGPPHGLIPDPKTL